MTVTPDQADLSAHDTPANGQSTWTYQNSPELLDANGNMIGSQDPTAVPPTDSYGYQNLSGPDNDGYSPYIAADGTNLGGVTAQGGWNPQCNDGIQVYEYGYWIWKKQLWTAVGEYHIN